MSDDEKLSEASRKRIDALVAKTTESLKAMLEGRADPHQDQSVMVALEKLRRQNEAQAGILGEACQLMSPVAAYSASIHSRTKILNLPAYEGNLGAASVTELEQPWLKLGALKLSGDPMLLERDLEECGRDRGHGSGPVLSEELYLLADGRLAEVTRIGRWEESSGGRTVRSVSLVRARILTLQQALRRCDLATLLEGMTRGGVSFDEDEAVAKERGARFRALVERAVG